jgi:hypothetical protein
MEDTVNVMDVARAIGLVEGPVTGTIDEAHVLGALADLAEGDPENEDLFTDAAARVRSARSAGAEVLEERQRTRAPRDVAPVQLRYRSEVADIFTDLAIDVGLRQRRELAEVR